MQMRSKTLLAVLCTTFLLASSVVGTLAYLTDKTEVNNTFTVGDIQITLDEAQVTPEGVPVTDAERVLGNEYHLVPGQTYTKDPTLTIKKGSEESYVRMLVTISCISQLRDALGADFLPQDHVTGWDSSIWIYETTTEDTQTNTVTYEFRYHKTVDAYESDEDIVLEPLFTAFTLPGKVTKTELAALSEMEITVAGHAIQVLGFESQDAAWTTFEAEQTN